ncbi:MAG: glucose 1-dehydrogenase [Chloroflexi bacterium]|nr:glucose 1-dehydrogenase [Chloroflexota bacterium]
MDLRFDGKAVLVTGGALGIGRGIAEAFAAAGASVAIADIDADAARAATTDLAATAQTVPTDQPRRDEPARIIATHGDVSIAADAGRMVDETVAAFGRLDVLVNNAGIAPLEWYARLEDISEAIWDRTIDVNLKGMFLMSRAAIPHLRAAGRGTIINLASVQGLQSMPRVAAYAASKGGILSLTRAMAMDYAHEGIRAVAICPGTMDSAMVRMMARAEGGDEDANVRRYGAVHPLGRIGTPADVGAAAVFLASDAASFITGEHLNVDGGFMALGAWASGAGADQ